MRRLFRHFFTLCSAVSLMLCVAAVGMWVSTWFAAPRLEYHASDARTGSA